MSNQLFDLGLSKLFEMLQSVVSIWTIRPTAKARAAERLMAAEAKAKAKLLAARTDIDVEKTKIEGKYELVEFEQRVQAKYLPVKVEVDIDIPVIWEVEPQLITADDYRSPFQPVERKRLNNIQQVTVNTIKALPEQGEVSEQHVDPDWTARFFENVKDVSNEDMQKLWGKLLAGEIASPGKFSLRTLDVLKNMTSVEAKIFEQAVRYCDINGQLLRVVIDIPSACKLSRKELMRLVECGLFHSPLDVDQTESDNKSKALLKAMRLAPNPFDITEGALVYTLTSVGAELATLNLNRGSDAKAGGDVCDEKKP